MDSIFVDLEFCMVNDECKEQRKISKFEIIEIGAVRVNEELKIVDRFETLVKPRYSVISSFITDMTHITNEAVADAPDFKTAMDIFLEWVGDERVAVYSWSNADCLQFQKECRQKKYKNARLEDMYENWVDFQMVFGKMLGIEQAISLANAVKGAGIEFKGQEHSALADAENTALLYILTKNKEEFELKAGSLLDIIRPKPALTMSLGSLITPEMLSHLPE